MTRSVHPDVTFEVSCGAWGHENVFPTLREAASHAVMLAIKSGGLAAIDVCVGSVSGARFYAGEPGVKKYEDKPDAPVFERLIIHVERPALEVGIRT